MEHLTSLHDLTLWRNAQEETHQRVVLVPTMGALHAGHLQLMKLAKLKGHQVIVSIFVNPLQFSPNEDFTLYPRTLAFDLAQCETIGVNAVWTPSMDVFYPQVTSDTLNHPVQPKDTTVITPPPWLTSDLCGKTRPEHFTGVATIVFKLLRLVNPHVAIFGQKDAQQLRVIECMVQDLQLPVEIIAHPIIREPLSELAKELFQATHGLARSSRNQYLTTSDMHLAGEWFAATIGHIATQLKGLLTEPTTAHEAYAPASTPTFLEAWLEAQWSKYLSSVPSHIARWCHKEYLIIKHWQTWQTLETLEACQHVYHCKGSSLLLAGVCQIKPSSEASPVVRLLDNHLLV
ncbi:MAG: pantoate--beta-alanine ligase [Vampirovibrionales bacterium]